MTTTAIRLLQLRATAFIMTTVIKSLLLKETIYDDHSHKIASVKGPDVYDDHSHKIGSVDKIRKEIDGAMGGVSVVALWLLFCR